MVNAMNRSEVFSFYDLTEPQQQEQVEEHGQQLAEESQYIAINWPQRPEGEQEEIIPLHMFERSAGKVWDGIYSTSYFSAYFLKLSKCGTGALIVSRYF